MKSRAVQASNNNPSYRKKIIYYIYKDIKCLFIIFLRSLLRTVFWMQLYILHSIFFFYYFVRIYSKTVGTYARFNDRTLKLWFTNNNVFVWLHSQDVLIQNKSKLNRKKKLINWPKWYNISTTCFNFYRIVQKFCDILYLVNRSQGTTKKIEKYFVNQIIIRKDW